VFGAILGVVLLVFEVPWVTCEGLASVYSSLRWIAVGLFVVRRAFFVMENLLCVRYFGCVLYSRCCAEACLLGGFYAFALDNVYARLDL
jgi:hypothetical protein